MESAHTIAELYAEQTQGGEPAEEHVAQLLALLEPGETVLFSCGWTEMSETPSCPPEGAWFLTHALVVAPADGSTLVWEYLTNHQIGRAAAAIEAALDDLD